MTSLLEMRNLGLKPPSGDRRLKRSLSCFQTSKVFPVGSRDFSDKPFIMDHAERIWNGQVVAFGIGDFFMKCRSGLDLEYSLCLYALVSKLIYGTDDFSDPAIGMKELKDLRNLASSVAFQYDRVTVRKAFQNGGFASDATFDIEGFEEDTTDYYCSTKLSAEISLNTLSSHFTDAFPSEQWTDIRKKFNGIILSDEDWYPRVGIYHDGTLKSVLCSQECDILRNWDSRANEEQKSSSETPGAPVLDTRLFDGRRYFLVETEDEKASPRWIREDHLELATKKEMTIS